MSMMMMMVIALQATMREPFFPGLRGTPDHKRPLLRSDSGCAAADSTPMLISNDYVLRRMSLSVTQPPVIKGDVTDTVFNSIISVSGDHQSFIDICHCRLVNAPKLKMLGMCVTLNYLDVSYTNIRDIDPIISNCPALRSLNLAGIDLHDNDKYQALGKVVNIEILSLAHTISLTSIDFCKHLLMLRSLSLTNTEIENITPLGGNRLTRLEDLCLDSCRKLDRSSSAKGLVDTLRGLPALRLLNTYDIKCVNEHAEFLLDFHPNPNLLIETKPRKILLLEAIMLNDIRMVRHCLATGCDVNLRTGQWAEEPMLYMWRRLCKKGRLQSPCFLVNHIDEELRPTPLHFAMMFGYVDIVKVIVWQGGDINTSVYWADATDSADRIEVDVEKAAQRPVNEYLTRNFATVVYDRNTHRLTHGMVERKVQNWKSLCADIFKSINDFVNDPTQENAPTGSRDGSKEEGGPTEQASTEQASTEPASAEARGRGEGQYDPNPNPIPRKPRKNLLATTLKQRRDDWHSNGLVADLIGDSFSLRSVLGAANRGGADSGEIQLLGRKDVWMESRVLNFKEKLRAEQADFEAEYQRRLSLLDSDLHDLTFEREGPEEAGLVRDIFREKKRYHKGIGSFGKGPRYPAAYRSSRATLQERRKYLDKLVEHRVEMRFKVRDDLEDEDEEAGLEASAPAPLAVVAVKGAAEESAERKE